MLTSRLRRVLQIISVYIIHMNFLVMKLSQCLSSVEITTVKVMFCLKCIYCAIFMSHVTIMKYDRGLERHGFPLK